nr:hypothetical protein [Mycobacterium pseudoshottsii]
MPPTLRRHWYEDDSDELFGVATRDQFATDIRWHGVRARAPALLISRLVSWGIVQGSGVVD